MIFASSTSTFSSVHSFFVVLSILAQADGVDRVHQLQWVFSTDHDASTALGTASSLSLCHTSSRKLHLRKFGSTARQTTRPQQWCDCHR
ncbi:hypothetical protein PF005_g17955 [Phytophthora fragariae]|uniref:Secreted protein n=2 Tax=Phytophthora TaxID=4783 RepID=A0A6A3XHS7_9STRA|nr:hypothetical protein PF003_g33001 [Phytophthora fragariae]KAE9010795.1 hypothetical protein PR002_g15266 [Phytophthora rubi]KAE8928856.1 hypothetical protein PF009_g21011 [Phytophthora fragariae]KAE9013259.1 hypothetical protein PR001_g15458 [Phytophthora rubi]KAE9193749.1 hypothetical protein PF005_g17955 [Phytophthora fragariae]